MKRCVGWFAMALLAVPVASGGERDELLEEVRALRRDLHAVAVTSQQVQLLVYRLHLQRESARRAKERSEQSAAEAAHGEIQMQRIAEQIKDMESTLGQHPDIKSTERVKVAVEQYKNMYKQRAAEQPLVRQRATDAEDELRKEQAKLDELDSRLDQLTRQLEGFSSMLRR